jgi:large conductance mechanosensitive channel
MLNEFKAFIAKGNVMDLAVGVIIGAAFGAIVGSLVEDIINPIIGLLVGGLDFSTLSFGIGDAQIMYGKFITAVIKFIIIAWVIFLMVKALNRMMPKKEAPPAPPPGPTELDVLMQIRDELAKK